MNDPRFELPRNDLEKIFQPSVGRALDAPDEEWMKIESEQRNNLAERARRNVFRFWLSEWFPLAPSYKYESKWKFDLALERVNLSEAQNKAIVWNGRRYFANSQGIKRIHISYLMHAIDVLRPRRVLEVGSGMGVNLTVLAAQYPDIEFAGLELSRSGYDVSMSLAGEPEIPQALADFSPRPIKDPAAHRRIDFRNGSATDIPFPDGSFDLVYSVQALEQMNAFRGRALREMARTSSHAMAMLEPFHDWNASGANRQKIVADRYFAAPIKELKKYGLRPVFSTADMPQKLFYTIGLVVALKETSPALR
jgi:SAM-dependent methyltransferase